MSNIAVVYYSGTGNTEIMAEKVAEGIRSMGKDVDIFTASNFNSSLMDNYDFIAFGCPSMGAEQLEESEFEPMFIECEPKLTGKKLVLFGSYDWGDGEWLRTWEENCISNGAIVVSTCMANLTPSQDDEEECINLGKKLVG